MASVVPAAIVRQFVSVEFLISNRTGIPAIGVLSGNLKLPIKLKVEPYPICSKSVESAETTTSGAIDCAAALIARAASSDSLPNVQIATPPNRYLPTRAALTANDLSSGYQVVLVAVHEIALLVGSVYVFL